MPSREEELNDRRHPAMGILAFSTFILVFLAWMSAVIWVLWTAWDAWTSCPGGGVAAGVLVLSAISTPFSAVYVLVTLAKRTFWTSWLWLDGANAVVGVVGGVTILLAAPCMHPLAREARCVLYLSISTALAATMIRMVHHCRSRSTPGTERQPLLA